MKVKELNDETFFEVVKNSEKLVIVDCYSPKCAPCKVLEPIMEKFAEEFPQADFYRIDVVENYKVMKEFGIFSVPCILFFKDGQLQSEVIGLYPEETLRLKIKAMLEA